MPRRSVPLPALAAPYPAALLTAAVAGDAPFWAALALFAGVSMAALVIGSTVVGADAAGSVTRRR